MMMCHKLCDDPSFLRSPASKKMTTSEMRQNPSKLLL